MGKYEKVAEVVAASLIQPGLVEDLVVELCCYEWQRLNNSDHTVFGDMVVQAVDEVFDTHGLRGVMDHKHVCRLVAVSLGISNIYEKDADRRG
jgi:hypothetical protein